MTLDGARCRSEFQLTALEEKRSRRRSRLPRWLWTRTQKTKPGSKSAVKTRDILSSMKWLTILSLFAVLPLMAAEFKSVKECVPGTAVQDRENLTGKVVAAEGGMCKVKLDRASY